MSYVSREPEGPGPAGLSSSTLVDVLRLRGALDEDRLAYRFLLDGDAAEETLTFAQLDERARAIGALLRSHLRPGSRALLVYTPGLPYIASFFGCLYAGVVAVPAYPPDPARMDRTLRRLHSVVQDADVSVVLTTGPLLSLADALLARVPSLAKLPWVATDEIDLGLSATWQPPRICPSTLAFLQYTSGSTANPKGVMLTHRNLLHNFAYMQSALELGPHTRLLSWLPPYHDMGLIGAMLLGVWCGYESTLLSPGDFLRNPLLWLKAATRFRTTLSPAPNFAYELCVRRIGEDDKASLDLSAWRVALNGSEPVRASTVRRFCAAFARCGFRPAAMLPAYGLAEATLMASAPKVPREPVVRSFCRTALAARRVVEVDPGEAGRALVGCGEGPCDGVMLVVDLETLEPTSQVGEVWISSDSVAEGYWQQPDLPAFVRRADGRRYLRTGDLGFLLDGELFVTGRLKDTIVIRGLNHAPEDIEHSVERAQNASRPGCTAVFGAESGEGVIVVSEARAEAVEAVGLLEEAAQAMRATVAAEHGLELVDVVWIEPGSIPKTTSGKLQRRACERSYHEGSLKRIQCVSIALGAPVDHPAEEALAAGPEIARVLRVPWSLDTIDSTLSELGVDSLRLAELAQHVAHRHGVTWDSRRLLGATVREVLEAVREAEGARPRGLGSESVVWDIEKSSPGILARLLEEQPELKEVLGLWRQEIPVPPSNGAFDDGRIFRPEGHFRAFYRRLGDSAAVAVKGADIGCDDQVGFLQILQQRPFERFAQHSITNTLEYFLLQERKVPGALTLSEALSEADKAARLQETFLDRRGELGAFPVPLLVHSWSREAVARFQRRLRPLLAGLPAEIFESEVSRGLACYIYYFPRPVAERVSHYANRLANEAQRTGQAGLRNTRLIHTTLVADFDPEALVGSWIDTVAEMLAAGWFPCDTKHFKNGQCIEPQNVLVNGSLADMDSIRPFDELASDREFYEHLLATVNLLCRTLRTFLIAEGNGTTEAPAPFPAQFPAPDFLDTLGVVFVWERLKARLRDCWGLDPRLEELVTSNLSFDVLFNRVLYAIYYSGPTIPEEALHMLNVTDAYTSAKLQTRSRTAEISYRAEMDIDAAAIATIPRSFLRRLGIPPQDFVRNFLDDQAALITMYDTFLGRIGLIVAPLEDDQIYLDRGRTADAVREALRLAARMGAQSASLTGLIPSATDYGRALTNGEEGTRCEGVEVTTGHATTAASCVMMIERLFEEAGRSFGAEDVACVGVGSIGGAMLELAIRVLPHPRSLLLVDLQSRAEALASLGSRLRDLGYRGELELCMLDGATLPDAVYERRCVLSATSVADLLDVDRLLPGTLVLDDSAPHVFDPRAARRRFQTQRDVLFTEAGAIRSSREVNEIYDLAFSTGWDGHIRSALRVLHPERHVIMGCVFSSLLTSHFGELRHTLGIATVDECEKHLSRLRSLGFRGAPLYCRDFALDKELIREFRRGFADSGARRGASAGLGDVTRTSDGGPRVGASLARFDSRARA